MKKSILPILFTITLALSFTLSAQTAKPVSGQNKAVARKRTIDPAKRYARTGGIVFKKNTGPYILFLNQQDDIPASKIKAVVLKIEHSLNLPCKLVSLKPAGDPLKVINTQLKDEKVATVISIGESDLFPSLLIAPEDRWAFVNISKLSDGKPSSALLEQRTSKELWRAFAYVMGAAHTQQHTCLMKPVLSCNDLDALKLNTISPYPSTKIDQMAAKLGINHRVANSYRKAVEDGWAPIPVDDVQRALWKKHKK